MLKRLPRAAKKVPISCEIYNNTRFAIINRLRARIRPLACNAHAHTHVYNIHTHMRANGRALFEIIILDRPVLSALR